MLDSTRWRYFFYEVKQEINEKLLAPHKGYRTKSWAQFGVSVKTLHQSQGNPEKKWRGHSSQSLSHHLELKIPLADASFALRIVLCRSLLLRIEQVVTTHEMCSYPHLQESASGFIAPLGRGNPLQSLKLGNCSDCIFQERKGRVFDNQTASPLHVQSCGSFLILSTVICMCWKQALGPATCCKVPVSHKHTGSLSLLCWI